MEQKEQIRLQAIEETKKIIAELEGYETSNEQVSLVLLQETVELRKQLEYLENPELKKKDRIFKVCEMNPYGECEDENFFKRLDKAEKAFDKKMAELQGELKLVAPDDDDFPVGDAPVYVRVGEETMHEPALKEGVINYWYQTGGECAEWERNFTTVVIVEIEVE
ncbi:hypothetical protein FT641_19150 [Bacillus paranthracis]|uniref:hypothetical protein n=1 Tax=Bacillus paranthracis TaxID=2026186 RepID=UPI0018798CFC|nr:hypothetical protein [Bacillus paranthracis]MBE7114316.1 hypothetical protein [Bacillus paranthracis]MBE7154811.1 hypothetical protein [Bacillus paranthracis]